VRLTHRKLVQLWIWERSKLVRISFMSDWEPYSLAKAASIHYNNDNAPIMCSTLLFSFSLVSPCCYFSRISFKLLPEHYKNAVNDTMVPCSAVLHSVLGALLLRLADGGWNSLPQGNLGWRVRSWKIVSIQAICRQQFWAGSHPIIKSWIGQFLENDEDRRASDSGWPTAQPLVCSFIGSLYWNGDATDNNTLITREELSDSLYDLLVNTSLRDSERQNRYAPVFHKC